MHGQPPPVRLALLAVATLAALAGFAFAAASSEAKPAAPCTMRTFAARAPPPRARQAQRRLASRPANGATVSGTVAWAVKPPAAASTGSTSRVDGVVKSSDSSAPFAYGTGSLDTTTLANGRHTLTATAYARAAAGKRDHSVTVANPTRAGADPAPPDADSRRPTPTHPGAHPGPAPARYRAHTRPDPRRPPRSTGAPGSATS